MIQDFKITSIEKILVTLLPNLKIFLTAEITLEATTQNNLSKSRKFSRKITTAEFHYS